MCSYDRGECLKNQTPPALKDGDVVTQGIFLRNLKTDNVSGMYANDANPPEFGYKVAFRHWRDSKLGDLSLNIKSCMQQQCCSIHLSNDTQSASRFTAVAEIDLEQLSNVIRDAVSVEVVAVYRPYEDNACHFELTLLDSGTLGEMKVLEALKKFTPDEKVPNNRCVNKLAELAKKSVHYKKVFLVHHCSTQ
jgi:hypothetical protein